MSEQTVSSDAPSLASLLRRWMLDRGLSQEQLAARSGVPKATIHRWLNGKSIRPYHHLGLLSLAVALNLPRISTNRLLTAAGFAPLDAGPYTDDPQEAELVARWQSHTRVDLPAPLSPFIGREREVADIGEMLARPEVRLLTLAGPGGSGKTRLAIRVAEELTDVYPDGIYFVPFASVFEADRMAQAVAESLGLRDVVDIRLEGRLTRWLHGRRVLLLLDNLEHLLEGGPEVGRLLRAAPGLSVIATSRVPLHLSGEHVWNVEPFSLPDPAAGTASLRANPAVKLFLQRAGEVHARLPVRDRELSAVAQICVRLDGLPLAIELAAGQLGERTPEQLLDEFPDRLGLASNGPRDVHHRQRTLRDTIAWGVDLLPERTRSFFYALTVFVGGWTEAAATDLAEELFASSACDVIRILDELGDANLIERTVMPDGTWRYRILETIREYGQQIREAQANNHLLRDRHAGYFLRLAESGPPYVPQVRTHNWYRLIDADFDNIRAAIEWVARRPGDQRLARFAASLWPYWHEYMRVEEGRRWLDLAVNDVESLPLRLRASVLIGASTLSMTSDRFEPGEAFALEALRISDAIGESRRAALALQQLCWLNYMLGRVDEATRQAQAALEHWRAIGDQSGIALGLSDLALVAMTFGDPEPAERYLHEAEALYLQMGDEQGLARIRRERGLRALLGRNALDALPLLQWAAATMRQAGRSYLLPATLLYLGIALALTGQPDAALEQLNEALALHEELDDKMHISLTLLGFAAVAHRQDQGLRAATLCGAAEALRRNNRIAMPSAVTTLYQREVDLVIQQVGYDAFAQRFDAGQDLTQAEAIAFARNSAASD